MDDPGSRNRSPRRRRSVLTTLCIGAVVLAFGFLAAAVTSESDGACKPKTDTGGGEGGGGNNASALRVQGSASPTSSLKNCGGGDDDDDDDDDDEDTTTGGVIQALTPVFGERVVVTVLSGTVLVKTPGSDVFVPLTGTEVLPVGTVIDARSGWIRLTSATGPTGALRIAHGPLANLLPGARRRLATGGPATQTADFFGWSFVVDQPARLTPVTEIRMTGGAFSSCPSAPASASSVKMLTRRSRVRRVWGSGKGRFQTRGRYAAATTRGTVWLTEDRCDGTLIAVRSGVVSVFDYLRKRTVTVSAGHVRLIRGPQATSG
jgi:hypothetical protein